VPAGAGAQQGAGAATGGQTSRTPQSQVATVDLARQPAAAAAVGRIVYFDFDSFVIKDEFKPVVEGNAKAAGRQQAGRMVIEGHTDERGGREYNLALGQKRAEAVVKSLALLGVAEARSKP
jgi:peptidoglycan-associated lipoprotein